MHMGISGSGHLRELCPGSKEAVERGCTCDPVENRNGNGQLGGSGARLFRPDDDCPLHGFQAVFGSPGAPRVLVSNDLFVRLRPT
jgi:hypothetical protein